MMICTNIGLFIGVVLGTIVYYKTGKTIYFPHLVTAGIVFGGLIGFGVKIHLDKKDKEAKAKEEVEEKSKQRFKSKKKKKKKKRK